MDLATNQLHAETSSKPTQPIRSAETLHRPSKMSDSHLARKAVLYIRQSTMHQLREHQESTARQYQLKDRLVRLGWHEQQIITIDEDLGVTGNGTRDRDGFRRVLKLVTDQQVGIVLGLEMSRLARNSKDWHDLFEVCAEDPGDTPLSIGRGGGIQRYRRRRYRGQDVLDAIWIFTTLRAIHVFNCSVHPKD